MRQWLRYRLWYPLLARLPLPLAYILAAAFGAGEWIVDRKGRQAIAKGLCCLFPKLKVVRQTRVLLAHFVMRSWEMLDAFVLMADVRRAARLVQVKNVEVLHQARAEGRGVILVMAHFGRVNLHALGLALHGEKLGMLTMAIEANPELEELERDYLRAKAAALHRYIGGCWVRQGDNLRELYRSLGRGETIVILIDAYVPGWEKRALTVPFLGGYLALPSGILRLAQRSGARLAYASAYQKGFQVLGHLELLPSNAEEAFYAAVKCLERDVQRYPWLWWQWNLVPLIWRPGGEGEDG